MNDLKVQKTRGQLDTELYSIISTKLSLKPMYKVMWDKFKARHLNKLNNSQMIELIPLVEAAYRE